MKNLKFALFLLTSLLTFAFASFPPAAAAQEAPAPPAAQNDKRGAPLLGLLNLTPEQINQIRAINLDTRGEIRAAAQKQRLARRALDAAIYAANPNSNEVEQRVREFGEAQAELSKLRARTEFRVRQVLTAEQLIRFRELRRRAVERATRRTQNEFGAPQQNSPKRLPLKNRPQL